MLKHYVKTFEEMCDDETICDYCSQTDYGEHKSYGTPNGQVFCEGVWCESSYEAYLDNENATENLVKYQNNVKLINKEELDMSKTLKFEFDFDEVFEGIKLGVIKEMSKMTFDDITSRAINEIKTEVKNKISLTYKDEYEMRDEIKKEIKEKVYQKIISDVKSEYKKLYEDSFSKDFTNVLSKTEQEVVKDIKSKTINRLYDDLYSDIQHKVKSNVDKSLSQIVDAVTGNGVKIKGTKETISKEEYESLIHRDEILTALENGGVDNWEWYGESLNNYFGDKED